MANMSDQEAGRLIEMMMTGQMPRFTQQEIASMNTDMRTPAQKYQDSRVDLAMMNANTGQKITKPRVAPQFAAQIANKTMRDGYDPSPDVGGYKPGPSNAIGKAADYAGRKTAQFGRNIQQAGPVGLLAGLAMEDAGQRVQKAGRGEADWYDPLMIGLDATALVPSMYMGRGALNAMKDKDRNSMLWRKILGE